MKRKRWVASIVVTAVAGTLGGFGASDVKGAKSSLPTAFLGCNTVWGDDPGEGSFRLGNNLDCPDDAIFIVKDGITVDLGGHRLTGPDLPGDGTDVGVFINASDVTVRNGVIASYNRGVFVNESSASRIQKLTIIDSEIDSIRVLNGSGNRITGNTIIEGTDTNTGRLAIQTTTLGGSNTISNNILVGVGMTVTDSDENVISGNQIYGADAEGILLSGESENNRVEGNTVIGAGTAGIAISGVEADDTIVTGNTVRGNLSGISVANGDRTRIIGNTATANGDGIVLSSGADLTNVRGNNASANRDRGIELNDGRGVRIIDNRANENGGVGIFAIFISPPVVSGNVANFNGYFAGANDNSILAGIDASGASGTGNKARGNDVSGASQCIPAGICQDGPPDPPPLTACGITISQGRTIRNPLVCDGNTHALRLQGSGYTVNLGPHVVTGGNAANEAAVTIANAASNLKITGGVLMDSEHGIFTPSAGTPARRITISKATIFGNDVDGIRLQGLDPTPGDSIVESGRHQVTGSRVFGNGAHGVSVSQAPFNAFRNNLIAANSLAGLDISQSRGDVVESNRLIGNTAGIDISNDADPALLPIGLTIDGNSVIGSVNTGIFATNMSRSSFTSNVVRGNGTTGQSGVVLSGSGVPGGSNDNVLRGNLVTASSFDGIQLLGDSAENRIRENTVSANDRIGIVVSVDAEANRVLGNKTNENGADAADLGGIVVREPADGNERPDIVSDNAAHRNGFLSTTETPNTGDGNGLGIAFASDTDGTGNVAKGNDDLRQCVPDNRC